MRYLILQASPLLAKPSHYLTLNVRRSVECQVSPQSSSNPPAVSVRQHTEQHIWELAQHSDWKAHRTFCRKWRGTRSAGEVLLLAHPRLATDHLDFDNFKKATMKIFLSFVAIIVRYSRLAFPTAPHGLDCPCTVVLTFTHHRNAKLLLERYILDSIRVGLRSELCAISERVLAGSGVRFTDEGTADIFNRARDFGPFFNIYVVYIVGSIWISKPISVGTQDVLEGTEAAEGSVEGLQKLTKEVAAAFASEAGSSRNRK